MRNLVFFRVISHQDVDRFDLAYDGEVCWGAILIWLLRSVTVWICSCFKQDSFSGSAENHSVKLKGEDVWIFINSFEFTLETVAQLVVFLFVTVYSRQDLVLKWRVFLEKLLFEFLPVEAKPTCFFQLVVVLCNQQIWVKLYPPFNYFY